MDLEALKNELENDPEGLGYAQHINTGADGSIEELINSVDNRWRVLRGTMSHSDFIDAFAGVIFQIKMLPDGEMKKFWYAALEVLQTVETVNLQNPIFNTLKPKMVQDGFATDEQLAQIFTISVSRAEFVCGKKVSHLEIAEALRPTPLPAIVEKTSYRIGTEDVQEVK